MFVEAKKVSRSGIEISILSLVQTAKMNALATHQNFKGLTFFDIQRAMKVSHHSNQSIAHNVDKLVKDKLLKVKDAQKEVYTVSFH